MATVSFASVEKGVGHPPRTLASKAFAAAKAYIEKYAERHRRVDWEEVLFALDSRDAQKRIWALNAVMELNDLDFLYKVSELCRDKDPEVRLTACKVYAHLTSEPDFTQFQSRLQEATQ
ncbi:MAG: hypothetical protein QXU54_03575 [Candidatus Micrarchaeia archaeon]